MIEPTDASKCDERQVKNKAKPLTKKKEGETRSMNSKSMKHWKMAALFVVGLMAVAGVFSSDVLAQTASVTISPSSVKSDSVVSRVTVHYTIQSLATDATEVSTGLTIELPDQLSAANDSGDVTGFMVITSTPAMSDLTAPTSLRDADGDNISYVTTTDTISNAVKAAEANYAITVNSDGDVTFPSVDMKRLNRITVVYHNVKVAQLTELQLEDRMVAVTTPFTVTDTGGIEAITEDNRSITLSHPTLSDIRVTPHKVKEKSTRDVRVTYQVKHPMLTDNTVSIALPDGLTSSPFVLDDPTADPNPTAAIDKTTDPYVTVTDTVNAVFDTAPVLTGVVLTVTGNMELNEKITVIYHNVVISTLLDRVDLPGYIVVSDSAVSPAANTGESGAAYVATTYQDKIKITISATNLSTVRVTPMSVKPESIRDMTVTYTAQDTVYNNRIEISLPDEWAPAYPEVASTFGDEALTAAPTTGAATTSYVVVESGVDLLDGSLIIGSNNDLSLIIDGNMSTGKTIEVTYHNVMVQPLTSSELDDRGVPVIAQFTVMDEITGSDYETSTQVTVAHPALSDIQVTPTRPVKTGSIIDMMVTYTAKDAITTSNEITIRIPEGWDPAYSAASPTFVDEAGVSAADKATTSYVKITSRLADTDSELTVDNISADGVIMTVTGDMEDGDRVVVSFHNVKVQSLADGSRMPVEAAIVVTDKLSTDGTAYEATIDTITVNPPELSTVTVAPTRVQASSIVRDVKVTYVITDPIAVSNLITIELPDDWEAAYANDGDPAVNADFGSSFDKPIDLDGDSTASPAVAAVRMVSTMPATLATGASASKTSYVEVHYTPRGTSMNTAAVSISSNIVMISVTGDMAARDRIVVTYHNVKVPALADRTAMDADIMVTDALSSNGAAYDGTAQIMVNPLPLNAVAVTPTTVKAETITDVKVTYSIKSTALDENTITVGLPEDWGPAYLPNDESSRSKSFGNFAESAAPSANRNSTSYVVVTSTLDDSEANREFTVSGLESSAANVSLVIDVEDTAAKGDNIVVTFYNVKVQELTLADASLLATLTVTDTIAGGESFDPTIGLSLLQRGAITRLPNMVTAEDELDLRIRYTATDDLADPDPDGDEDTDDATYGKIQIILPDGWASADGTALSATDLTVNGSSNVEFADDDNRATIIGQVITIDVDSLKDGKYVDITVNSLRVADFPADEAGDKIYAEVGVLSDSFDSAAASAVDLVLPAAHLSSKFSPKVSFTAATATAAAYGSDIHPTITVNRKYLGEVAVTPASVVAEATTDLKVRYTATNTLADPSDSDSVTAGVQGTSFGRVQITLPEGWEAATDGGIYTERQAGDRDATYLSLRKSSGVTAVALSEDSFELDGDRYRINIDVNAMRSRQWVELTVHNLMIASLSAERTGSFDPDITAVSEKVQVEVFSETFSVVSDRDNAFELESPSAHSPVKGKFTPHVAAKDTGSDTQPTLSVTRKQLGKVAIAPAKVSAGSAQKFTITYTASEMLEPDSVIEVRLPNWGGDDHSGVPTAYQLDDDPIPAADDKGPHVYLSGSKSRLEGSTVTVQEDGDTSIVRIALGEKGLAKNNSVALKFEGVTVQREIAAAVLIEVFSSDSVDLGVPQYPVEKPEEDKIEVTHAADGSGKVMFEFEGVPVIAFDNDKVKSNTNASVPAGLMKGDTLDLIVTYMPEGDMVGDSGTAEFQITLPGNWQAEDVRSPGSDVSRSDNTITAKFKNHFGETEESLEIVLEDITVPDDHGNDRFVAKSRNAKGSLKTLSPIPMVFVGNTLADNDAMSVEIDPLAAYEGEEDVDFEITLTANGPMHDSDIQITVPDGIESLQTGESGDPNYVRKVAPSGSGVVVRVDDANDENILITTGKLNKGGTIIVRLNNVDIDGDVSTDNATGFRVYTRTRGTDGDTEDDDNLTDVAWALIEKDDGARSIVGGEIRTITGSGAIALKPATVQQGSQNVDFDFTFLASTAFSNKTLTIAAPSVIETPLVETAGDGQVTVSGGRYDSGVAGKDRLVVSDDTITVAGLILRKGERFAIKVNNVDLFDRTGEFRWAVTLDGTALRDADNPPMVVVGTTESDVAFEIVDDTGAPISLPSYPAASLASIRFRFTAENTVIQPGGRLRFTVPVEWSLPSVTDRANRATVSIVHLDDDGNETFVAKVADKWALSARGRDVTLTIDPKGKLDPGSSVIIRYGTPDTKYPVQISDSVRGTAASDEDGLSIRGHFKVSSATGFPERDAGKLFVDITNVKDGTGTATVTPPSVRASSTDNLIRVVYTAIGTMDGGAVRITIPQNWGLPQNDDAEKPNYVNVTVSSGAKLTSEVLHDDGRFVQANLTTLGAGDNVSFTYGGGRGASKGAVAQADLGDVVFLVESRGSSGGTFEAIVDNMDKAVSPIVEVKSAKSGSGQVAVAITNNKSGSVVYDGVAERRIFAGDDKTYLVLTYTAEQTIAEGELELIVPSGWTAPQQDDTNRPGYTYIEEGNALVSEEEYNGQSVTATIEMDRGDVIKIHYGWYATEDGGAHAPQAPGTYVFRVEFDGVGVAIQPSVIVHGGTASKLVVTAPSSVSADLGTAPVAITVEIQDDTNAVAVVDSDLEVTLSSTSSTGSFTDADGEAIAGNKVTISAGSTEATAYYSDTGAGTTATVRAMAVGLDSGRATIEVTSDMDTVDESSISVSPATAKAGDSVMVTASGTAGKTATFSVGAVVTTMTMTESPANSGSYSGSFNVVQDQHDGTHNVTVAIGDASAMGQMP